MRTPLTTRAMAPPVAGSPRRRWAHPFTNPVVRAVLGLGTTIGLWWTLVAVLNLPTVLLPSPADIAHALAGNSAYLAGEAWATLWQTLAGFALATAAGLGTAITLTGSRWLRETVLPLVVATQAIPKVALAPLFIVWFGFGPASKLALICLLAYFPVHMSTMAGLTATPTELVDLARSLTASRRHTYLKIRLPYALPQMFTGLKLGVSLALIGAVVAQISTPNAGLGAVIVLSGQTGDTPLAFAAIVLLAACGITFHYTLVGLQHLLAPWTRTITAAGPS